MKPLAYAALILIIAVASCATFVGGPAGAAETTPGAHAAVGWAR